MKIQKQLLESLIRVCAKEVLAQLNEGKKKSKKRKVVKEIELPDEEESDEPNEEEDKNDICPTCNGSGEGMADGLSCSDCKGSGSTHSKNKHDDDEPDGGFVNRDRGEDEARNWGGIDEEDSETVGASSTGSGESVDIETERPEIDSEPSEKETPKKKEKLQGIVLLTPSGELRQVPFRQWADESSIERTLHKVGASIGGNKVKIAISTMKKVRVGMSDKTPTYIFLGKYDPNGEELFVMADRDLNSAKEQAVKPEDISGEASGNAIEKYNTDQEINNDDELLAKRMAGADKSSIGAEIGYDDSESGQD
jgi:hypothetical protein